MREGVNCRQGTGRRRGAAPTELLRATVGPVLLLVAVLAGLAGCAPSDEPELVVPSVFYVSRDPDSTDKLDVQERGAARVTVTFDARDLEGVAVVRTAMDICPVRLPVFRCTGQDDISRSGIHQHFRLSPARGATAGESAVLRYRVTSSGSPAVTGSTRIVVGKPVLAVDARPDRHDVDPGGTLGVSLTLRNTGDVPARGVALFMSTRDGLAPAVKHRNCRYRGATSTWCRLPAADVVIPPGASYRLGAREVLRAGRDATYPSVSFQAAALGTDYVPPDELASQYEPGDGAALRLVPAGGRGGAGKADGSPSELTVPVRNEADLAAVAGTARGPVGSLADVRVGVRNDGPGALPAPVRVEFTVPSGTTVVSSPYEFDRDEEVIDQECRALAPDGTPLAEPSLRQPTARRYVCTASSAAVGATKTFPFTLRIDRGGPHHGGRVTVSGGEAGRPALDATTANDTAEVAVAVWPGPSWATPGRYEAAAVVLGVLLLAGAVGVRRRKRPRPHGGGT
ncbi:hypothetical protein ABT133_02295 [Streptomyces sp. NPDC001835]|uniref:hypothetical protein n=1 Tax=Streptomyces sp. NPDC001835 TaxID=3154528 RepID=UPI003322EE64